MREIISRIYRTIICHMPTFSEAVVTGNRVEINRRIHILMYGTERD